MYAKSYRAARGQMVKTEEGSMAHTETLEKRDKYIQAAKMRSGEPTDSSGREAKILGTTRGRSKKTFQMVGVQRIHHYKRRYRYHFPVARPCSHPPSPRSEPRGYDFPDPVPPCNLGSSVNRRVQHLLDFVKSRAFNGMKTIDSCCTRSHIYGRYHGQRHVASVRKLTYHIR